jgi:LEA14-like dessication related protein
MFRPGTKKTFISLLLILLLAGVILFVIRLNKRNSSVVETLLPEIHVLRVDITGISEEEINLRVKVSLENRMPIGVLIDSIAYIIFIEDKQIAQSMYPKKIDIDANGKSSINLPVSLAYKKLGTLFGRLHRAGKDSTLMRMDVQVYSSLIPKDSALVHIHQMIPVLVLPRIHLKQLQIANLSTSGATVKVTMSVVNENTMRFAFHDSKYKIIFEDHKAIEGVIPHIIELPAKDSAVVTIPLELDFKQIGQTLADYIRKGKDMTYDVTITTRPVTNIETLKDSDIILHDAGKLKTIKDAADKK